NIASGFVGNFPERTVLIISVQLAWMMRLTLTAHGSIPAKNIDASIVVEVGPGSGLSWMKRKQPCAGGYVCEGSIAVVSRQGVRLPSVFTLPRPPQDQYIRIAIVVVIPLDYIQAAGNAFKAGVHGKIGKCAVSPV